MPRGPAKGSRSCDFVNILCFLRVLQKNPRSVYYIYNKSSLDFDIKKVYRYLRYCLDFNLIELDHEVDIGFKPAKYYRLTTAGEDLMKWAVMHIPNIIWGSQK